MHNRLPKLLSVFVLATSLYATGLANDCMSDLTYLRECLPACVAPDLARAHYRYTVSGKRETQQMLDRFPRFEAELERALAQQHIPLWVKYLPMAESRLKPQAVSYAGATGLWQIMPSTARHLGLKINSYVDERLDTRRSSQAAARYLALLYRQFDDWLLTLAAYNCGPGNVRKAQRKAGGYFYHEICTYLPKQTQRYIPRVLTIASIAQQPEIFGFKPAPPSTYPVEVAVYRSTSLPALAQYFGTSRSRLAQHNPSLLTDTISVRHRPHILVIPADVYYNSTRLSVLAIGKDIVRHNDQTLHLDWLGRYQPPERSYRPISSKSANWPLQFLAGITPQKANEST